LVKDQYVVWPHFLVKADVNELCADMEHRFAIGDMKDAAVKGSTMSAGQAAAAPLAYDGPQQRTVIPSVRNTATCWLDLIAPKSDVEGKLMVYLDTFRLLLASHLDLDLELEDTETLFARYPIGGFYKQHSDSHTQRQGGRPIAPRDTERVLSFILYVNDEAWQEEDGGELRLFGLDYAPWAKHVDVAPQPGTLLLFFSRDLLHEVLVTNKVRRSIVGWFRVRAAAPKHLAAASDYFKQKM